MELILIQASVTIKVNYFKKNESIHLRNWLLEERNSVCMVTRERMLSVQTERTALFFPQVTMFSVVSI